MTTAQSRQINYYDDNSDQEKGPMGPEGGRFYSSTIVWNSTIAPEGETNLSVKKGYDNDHFTAVKFFRDLTSRSWKPDKPQNEISALSNLVIGEFLVFDEKVNCLIDTGAEANLADAYVVYNILKAKGINPRNLIFNSNVNCNITGATGHPLQILGELLLPFKRVTKPDNRIFLKIFIVADRLPYPFVLGPGAL